MAEYFMGALLHCPEGAVDDLVRSLGMVRFVAHAELVGVEAGKAVLVTFTGRVRDEEMERSVIPMLGMLRLVTRVEPIAGERSQMPFYDLAKTVSDLADSLQDRAPAAACGFDLDKRVNWNSACVFARGILEEASLRIVRHARDRE